MGFSQTGLTPPPTNVAVDARRIEDTHSQQPVAASPQMPSWLHNRSHGGPKPREAALGTSVDSLSLT